MDTPDFLWYREELKTQTLSVKTNHLRGRALRREHGDVVSWIECFWLEGAHGKVWPMRISTDKDA